MRKILLVLAPLTLGSSFVDECTRLCDFDGGTVCTGGSWTKDGGICHAYFHGGSRGDYCYHTAATKATCPSSGRAVFASEVDQLIAVRTGSRISAVSRVISENFALNAVPISLSPLSTRTSECASPIILAAISRIPLGGRYFDEWNGDGDLSRQVVQVIQGFTQAASPEARWTLGCGDQLRDLAEISFESRNVLMRPLLILVGHICSLPGTDCPRFLAHVSIADFFLTSENSIIRFIKANHRSTSTRSVERSPSEHLMRSFVAPLVHIMPCLMESAEMRSIVFGHRMIEYRTGPDSIEYYPYTFVVHRATAFLDSVEKLNGDSPIRMDGVGAEFVNESIHGQQAAREWFKQVTLQIHGPDLGLFRQRQSAQPHFTELTATPLDFNNLYLYRAVGRFLGLALIQGNPVAFNFPLFYYAKFLAQEVTLEDLMDDDPDLYSFLVRVNAMSSDAELASQAINIEGELVGFTLSNRADLIRRKLNSLIDSEVEMKMNWMVSGFQLLIPSSALHGFTPRTLREMLAINYSTR